MPRTPPDATRSARNTRHCRRRALSRRASLQTYRIEHKSALYKKTVRFVVLEPAGALSLEIVPGRYDYLVFRARVFGIQPAFSAGRPDGCHAHRSNRMGLSPEVQPLRYGPLTAVKDHHIGSTHF